MRPVLAALLTVACTLSPLAAQDEQPPALPEPASPSAAPVVALPPMIVAESANAPVWLYVAAGDTEFLSRCTVSQTKSFVAAQLEIHRRLRALVPAEFLAAYAVPHVSILAPVEAKSGAGDAVLQDMLRGGPDSRRTPNPAPVSSAPPTASTPSASDVNPPRVIARRPATQGVSYTFLPNQRLDDRDTWAVFTFLDPATFAADRLAVARDYLHFLLARRTPMLPQWFIEGMLDLHDHVDPRAAPMPAAFISWLSRDDTDALRHDPDSRRVLLPCNELFAADGLSAPANRTAPHAAAWRAQAGLFVRWAFDPANAPARASLWKLLDRASREAMSEQMFTECFGFGYAELLERLSDYLPTAVREGIRLPVGQLPPVPAFTIAPATPAQIARLRGEWERLEIPFVRQAHPDFLNRYIDQARKNLRRALAAGDRDPQLLAVAGLCELDAGDPAAARPLLESAAAEAVVRPRLYFELARLRWAELEKNSPGRDKFTTRELQPVLDLLRTAMGQIPPIPEVYLLAMEACLACTEATPAEDFARFEAAAPLLRRYPAVGFNLALLQGRQGRRVEAIATLNAFIGFISEPDMLTRYQQLQAALGPK